MRELVTLERFAVDERGLVGHVVHVGDDPLTVGEWVLLDGALCVVSGVAWPAQRGVTSIVVEPVARD
jgi:hypothetical protein